MNRNYLQRLNTSKTKTYGIGIVVIALIVIALIRFNPFHSSTSQVAGASKTSIKDALATMPINKEFVFPLKDDEKGTTVGQIKYTIESAELRDEIIIKGQRAYAVDGKVFLILNLKVANESSKNISMLTKDYVRVFVNGNENEPLSATITNDPVKVDAISVKPTRIGLSINKSDKDIKLKVGEIKGDKQTVDLKF